MDYIEFLIDSIISSDSVCESHWAKRQTKDGLKQVKKEYEKHRDTRNSTGAARDQNKRKRNTKRGALQATARDKVRQAKNKGELVEPKVCPICGSNPGKTRNGLSNMIFDHDNGYDESDHLSGRWMCRTCHNKKDNNKPGDKPVKNKRRSDGLDSIGRSDGNVEILKASVASESFGGFSKFFGGGNSNSDLKRINDIVDNVFPIIIKKYNGNNRVVQRLNMFKVNSFKQYYPELLKIDDDYELYEAICKLFLNRADKYCRVGSNPKKFLSNVGFDPSWVDSD